jgi:hypothetical protein
MGDDFINDQGNFPSDKLLEYLRPLVGPLGEFATLKYQQAPRQS